jgi:hypothetical protein
MLYLSTKNYKRLYEQAQDVIKAQDASFIAANALLARRGLIHDSKGRFLSAGTMDFNKARKAVKNGN